MRVRLEYGRDGLEVDLPDTHVVRSLAYKHVQPLPDPRQSLIDALGAPIGSPSLAHIAAGKRSVTA